ncbi:MAG: hypothetical protein HY817_00230 [Candidatus Abawacabacteria bacterium]|nr:hypothetical protein [Candidatus Abawacabacteria bacterium]
MQKSSSKLVTGLGVILSVGVLSAAILTTQNNRSFLASVIDPQPAEKVESIVPLDQKPENTQPTVFGGGLNTLNVRKLVSVNGGPFQDADTLDTAVSARSGDSVDFLININNTGSDVEYVTVEDIFPAQLGSYNLRTSCWNDSDPNSVEPNPRLAQIHYECQYSPPSQRFFRALTTISPDLFYINPPYFSGNRTEQSHVLHILVRGHFINSRNYSAGAGAVCNQVVVNAGWIVIRDNACSRIREEILAPEIIRTPLPKVPEIVPPLPEPKEVIIK